MPRKKTTPEPIPYTMSITIDMAPVIEIFTRGIQGSMEAAAEYSMEDITDNLTSAVENIRDVCIEKALEDDAVLSKFDAAIRSNIVRNLAKG